MTDKHNMPEEIWAWDIDPNQGCWDLEGEYPSEGCRTEYIRKDIHEAELAGGNAAFATLVDDRAELKQKLREVKRLNQDWLTQIRSQAAEIDTLRNHPMGKG